jgi:hypothetical protein
MDAMCHFARKINSPASEGELMSHLEEPPAIHLNWDAILMLLAVLLVSTGMWGAAIGALVVLLH